MTEIFITNIQNEVQSKNILDFFKIESPELEVSFDLNETVKTYPCGHTILRVEGDTINLERILTSLGNLGYSCEILQDKVCI
ncbi:hypothetical protein [Arcicella rigui]|uniref:Uncharacterized protein n=1 Tax=Arcicella rigui TaxID=797020 RepID=A0ABU5Q996_9BACT|nr:hypothetical protein [Arcicella rigui]MEA5139420.1 hypothetical protein [Arcicella rigui]